jgi:hypothetical protein
MTHLLYLPILLFSLLFSPEQPRTATAKPDVCRVYGQVYFDKGQPRDLGIPYFVVYPEQNDAFADLIVFKEDNKLFADGPGLWYETKDRGLADFIVYLTDRRGLADFSVNYTESRSLAGCKR